VVRTAAGEVRKRLAQYYPAEGCDDEIRIDVPLDSYVAQFRLMDIPALMPVASFALSADVEPKKWRRARWALLLSAAANVLPVAALASYVAP
jgi:hypothetical protein